ncbi:MAG: hypothetical protein HZB19_02325 [Chloroflexi bacterium]|nr:hypothetical protein [Chloroflexota bacterium]
MSNFDQLTTVLGVLGAYFAVILVLAVSVETILEPFTSLPWLRKKLDPDDLLKDIKEWLPEGSDVEIKAAAVQNLTTEYKAVEVLLQKNVQDVKEIADQALEALGPESKITQAQKDLALKITALRRQYAVDERHRITILRVISGVIGIVAAILLRIDTFDILGSLLPEDVSQILTQPNAQIGGMIITGLAASAGSSFWHDMLGRMRNLKETVQQVQAKV